ncbi:MAG: B12-binding domain-containing radical SAM protein, partial [Candidatus Dadabacteria bacterium]|nr:B12-binding domain-containing radical SAM protein [Candidatus Dadabacteria bacterium]
MKLLLINPRFPESFWSFKWAVDNIMPRDVRTINPPLGLATLAALCPPDWEIEIIDENIETIPLHPVADVIGVCGMGVQFQRQKELLRFYRNRGYYVVAGGSYASLCPEYFETLADTVVAGEAEYIWKRFCSDFDSGSPQMLYKECEEVSLEDSPTPRFDLLKLDKYQAVSLQFSRGCPYRCEFCDIIVMFGRKPRVKAFDQVGKELDALRKLGVTNVFFVDDNLIGNKPVAKKLMAYLRDYQKEHGYQFLFGTEASLNIAQDDELLDLFRQANFGWVFIGIESPDEGSLKETLKFQNTRGDILGSIRHVYSYGIEVLAGFIIGFDNDTVRTFDLQYNFIQNSGIQAAMIGLLTAVPKTPLYERLEKDGRLIKDASGTDNTKLGTNLIPKQMTYEEMVDGYRELYFRLLDDRTIADRILNKTTYLKEPIFRSTYGVAEQARALGRFIMNGIVPGGLPRAYQFLRTFPFTNPGMIPLVIQDWTIGISMRNYVDRHFMRVTDEEASLARNHLATFELSFGRYLDRGVLEVSLDRVRNAAHNLSISIKGMLDVDFFDRVGTHLESVLKDTPSSVTLKIEDIHDG